MPIVSGNDNLEKRLALLNELINDIANLKKPEITDEVFDTSLKTTLATLHDK